MNAQLVRIYKIPYKAWKFLNQSLHCSELDDVIAKY